MCDIEVLLRTHAGWNAATVHLPRLHCCSFLGIQRQILKKVPHLYWPSQPSLFLKGVTTKGSSAVPLPKLRLPQGRLSSLFCSLSRLSEQYWGSSLVMRSLVAGESLGTVVSPFLRALPWCWYWHWYWTHAYTGTCHSRDLQARHCLWWHCSDPWWDLLLQGSVSEAAFCLSYPLASVTSHCSCVPTVVEDSLAS